MKKKTLDVIHSRPGIKTKKGAHLPAHFNTALVNVDVTPGDGVAGKLNLYYNVLFLLFK